MPEVNEQVIKSVAKAAAHNDTVLAQGVANLNIAKAGRVWTVGLAMACTISWSANKSILWMMFHGCISWAYVIYYAFGFGHP